MSGSDQWEFTKPDEKGRSYILNPTKEPLPEIKWKTYMRCGMDIADERFNIITVPRLEIGKRIHANGLMGDMWEANVTEDGFAKDPNGKMGFCLEYLDKDNPDLYPWEEPHWVCTGLINLAALHKLELYGNCPDTTV